MKIIALILSIYILALNFSPCEDISPLNGDDNIELSHDTEDGHSDFDLCSPFCQCNCCQIIATYQSSGDLIISSQYFVDVFVHYDSFGKDYSNTILQPPRI